MSSFDEFNSEILKNINFGYRLEVAQLIKVNLNLLMLK